ncbi:AMP-binding protein [Synechococcus sp. CS-1324]|uniref:AMP-binding protein n=1 Tax=Synechococcus sp. CS-1324 TaxID=2847980 RepID=UPI000DB2FB95|nr:AMP-binding protein [Synechococcus sp. CS-1324]MCT0231363.1 AMP-binding protein [Synechococcus sp. CS-1324]PZV02663.1 MAG: o-succinylbenzoate--CoA ligase [Cyanobium sp.]
MTAAVRWLGGGSVVTATGPGDQTDELEWLWGEGAVVALARPEERNALAKALPLEGDPWHFWGPAVLIGSGGSSGGRRWCLQPLEHLRQSAEATGTWLRAIGIDPAGTLLVNPLPLHHVSGLLPLVRSRQWGVPLQELSPALMRHPGELAARVVLPADRQALLSLVPTQLQRLLADPAGVDWLAGFAVIWVGGAALEASLAAAARQAGIRLAPCYGATETAAMVTALCPQAFLAGQQGCGQALADVELRLTAAGAIEVRTARLSPGCLRADGSGLEPLAGPGGWWRSGDAGRLDVCAWRGIGLSGAGLQILGRLDGAIQCGGETVFPARVEQELKPRLRRAGIGIAELLLLPVADAEWGGRLVALFRPEGSGEPALDQLVAVARALPPAQRPWRWVPCLELERNPLGKWELNRWRAWLDRLDGQGTTDS